MVLAQARIHAQQIALAVVLLLEILGRLDARHAAEIVLADDADAEIFGLPQLLALLRARESFGAHHDERRPGGDFVRRRPAESDHERLGFLAAERRKFAGEHDDLIGERES